MQLRPSKNHYWLEDNINKLSKYLYCAKIAKIFKKVIKKRATPLTKRVFLHYFQKRVALKYKVGITFPININKYPYLAHYVPFDKNEELGLGWTTIDFGFNLDGYTVDNMVILNFRAKESMQKWQNHLEALSQEILEHFSLESNTLTIRNIGCFCQNYFNKINLYIVENLRGHSISRWTLHRRPWILHHSNNDLEELRDGTVFTIEPNTSPSQNIEILEIKNWQNAIFKLEGKNWYTSFLNEDSLSYQEFIKKLESQNKKIQEVYFPISSNKRVQAIEDTYMVINKKIVKLT